MKPYIPKRLVMQWHITDRCNLRCKHCYQENYKDESIPPESPAFILKRYRDYLIKCRQLGKSISGRINLTGGEPFIHDELWPLLEMFHNDRELYGFALLTNGTLITPEIAKKLGRFSPNYIQISIEGKQSRHDQIRGPGSYVKAVCGIKALKKEGIPVYISFTVHQENWSDFPSVAELGRKLKVDRVWTDRLIPMGEGTSLAPLEGKELRNFFRMIGQIREQSRFQDSATEIGTHRALQFLESDGSPYRCKAGDQLIAVMPNGDLYPCRRLPIKQGNLFENSLMDIYTSAPLLRQLREKEVKIDGCAHCEFEKSCNGGLKCLSYAVHGTPWVKDPGCYQHSKW